MYTIDISRNSDPGLCARKIWAYLARQVDIYEWEGEDALDSFLCDLKIFEKYIREGMERIELWWDCDTESGYTDLVNYDPGYVTNYLRFKIEIDPSYEEIRSIRITRIPRIYRSR